MIESLPEKYQPTSEIRTNHRFAAFEGLLGGEKIFIKSAVDPELRSRLKIEADGLIAMRQLDPDEHFYHVPQVIELADDYIVTEWVDGVPMSEEFRRGEDVVMRRNLNYLARLYAFFDRSPDSGRDISERTVKSIDRQIERLRARDYASYGDAELVARVADYVKENARFIVTKTTHGDLQPGNIMITDSQMPTVIDCESFCDFWPRHYNAVNFVFNYGAEYPYLRPQLQAMLSEYAGLADISLSESIPAINFSAAIRSIQLLNERLSGDGLSDEVKSYVEASMHAILAGRLFFETDN